MSSFTVLRHVPLRHKHFYLQCSSMFSLSCYGLYLLFTISFSAAADNEHSYFVEIPVERSIFECNIKKKPPRSLQLKNVIFKNRNVQLRFEIAMTDIRD